MPESGIKFLKIGFWVLTTRHQVAMCVRVVKIQFLKTLNHSQV